jgi:Na+/H+ antiporter NhaD/arsenite permease-like protein
MEAIVIILFVVGYLAIALEHPIKINKTASALLTGVICWTIYAVSSPDHIEEIGLHLGEHLGEIAAILFFLMGAMTIVELVDAYQGFKIITDRINTKKPKEATLDYL